METIQITKRAIVLVRVSTKNQLEGAKAQLQSCIQRACRHGIALDVDEGKLIYAIRQSLVEVGDLYLGYGESGYNAIRNGFEKLKQRIASDKSVAFIFTDDRQRIARPENSAIMVAWEHSVRQLGVTLFIGDQVLKPLVRGEDDRINAMLALNEYSSGRKFLKDLSVKVIQVKAQAAKMGFWTGGRPPFGFERVLIDPKGNVVRALKPGEVVRQLGYHTSIRVAKPENLGVWFRILNDYDPQGRNYGGKRIAKALNAEGVPSPNAGLSLKSARTKIVRDVPGTWTSGEVYARIDDPTIIGIRAFGKRAMGEHARLGPGGVYRELYREEYENRLCGNAKVTMNPPESVITSAGDWIDEEGWLLDAEGKRCIKTDRDLWNRCQDKRKRNAGSQKGVPKSFDPARYPLAGRVFCASCRTPMHGTPRPNRTYCYKCGLYVNSGGAKCDHNWILQDDLLFDVAVTIRECALPRTRELREMIRQRAEQRTESLPESIEGLLAREHAQQVKKVQRAMEALAQAKSDEERDGLRKIWLREKAKQEGLEAELGRNKPVEKEPSVEELVAAAIAELKNLEKRLRTSDPLEVKSLMNALNVRVWLAFKKERWGKRIVNRLERGTVCLGSAPDPVGLEAVGVGLPESDSLCKDGRGDRI